MITKVCPDCTQEERRKHLERVRESNYRQNYGITIKVYDEMLSQQDGKCAICGTPEPGKARKHFSVDHDHVTGEIRALLCGACNCGLGNFKDNPTLLASAIEYLTLRD